MRQERTLRLLLTALLILASSAIGVACEGGGDGGPTGVTTGEGLSGDQVVAIGETVTLGSAVITVRALQDAFQPVTPAQKMSEESPVAPAAGESFYQAYVRVENQGSLPLRVDPEHFACQMGNTVSTIEPTRSGPPARSLIYNTSMDLLLTFRGPAGQDPLLIYSPPWYDGVVSFDPKKPAPGATTTQAPVMTTTTLTPGFTTSTQAVTQ
jgi:hypothetical protein